MVPKLILAFFALSMPLVGAQGQSTSSRQGTAAKPLPAPKILGPAKRPLYPPHSRIKLGWKGNPEAQAYRFRLWNEDAYKQDQRSGKIPRPRWETQVSNPWIEVYDAPLNSYMFLDAGTYRWDVAAIDKQTGQPGEAASDFFEVSPQSFLKPRQLLFRTVFSFQPEVIYKSDSVPADLRKSSSSAGQLLEADADWFFSRRWGASAGAGFGRFKVRPFSGRSDGEALTYLNAGLGVLFRTYFSTSPSGWMMTLSVGAGVHEFPQIDRDSMTDFSTSKVKQYGPKAGVMFSRRFSSPWEAQFRATSLLPLTTTGGSASENATKLSVHALVDAHCLYHASQAFAPIFGVGAESRSASFTASPQKLNSTLSFLSYFLNFGIQFGL